MRRVLPLLFVAACSAARPAASPPAPADDPDDVVPLTPDTSPIGLRRSVLADEYFWLRTKALEGDAPPAFAEALAAMQELRADLSRDPTAWEDLEVPLGSVHRAHELAQAYGHLPEQKDIGGRTVPLRARALRLARAIGDTKAAFRAGPFREHEAEIQRAASDLAEHVLPRAEAIVRAIELDLGLPGGGSRPVVVTLVADAPYPGIFAADARGKVAASFVRVKGLAGSALAETLLAETLHAFDELTVRAPTAMNQLRAALVRRGLGDGDPGIEMAVGTVTFAEAASLVRRFVDPAHRPLGEDGFYTLFPPAPAIVAAWQHHVAGAAIEVTADEIAAAVAAP